MLSPHLLLQKSEIPLGFLQHGNSSMNISPHYKKGRVSVHTVDSPFFFYPSFRSSVAQQERYRYSRVGAESNHTVSLPSSIYTSTTLGSPNRETVLQIRKTKTLKYHRKDSDPLLSHSCWSFRRRPFLLFGFEMVLHLHQSPSVEMDWTPFK